MPLSPVDAHVYPSIEVVTPEQMNAFSYNSGSSIINFCLAVFLLSDLWTSRQTLNPTRMGTGSQCRTSQRSGVTWSYFLRLHSSLPAALGINAGNSKVAQAQTVTPVDLRCDKGSNSRSRDLDRQYCLSGNEADESRHWGSESCVLSLTDKMFLCMQTNMAAVIRHLTTNVTGRKTFHRHGTRPEAIV